MSIQVCHEVQDKDGHARQINAPLMLQLSLLFATPIAIPAVRDSDHQRRLFAANPIIRQRTREKRKSYMGPVAGELGGADGPR